MDTPHPLNAPLNAPLNDTPAAFLTAELARAAFWRLADALGRPPMTGRVYRAYGKGRHLVGWSLRVFPKGAPAFTVTDGMVGGVV